MNILTLGLGSFSTVNFLPTLGYTPKPFTPRTIDTHDGFVEEFSLKRRKEELHEQILRAMEFVTGESEVKALPTAEQISKLQKAKPAERRLLSRVKEDLRELEEINQQQELNDIAFIVGLL